MRLRSKYCIYDCFSPESPQMVLSHFGELLIVGSFEVKVLMLNEAK
jgi:5-keto 4-deoxyuronate isomerase